MSLKQIIKRVARARGFEIRRIPARPDFHQGAFSDQAILLRGTPQPVVFDLGANVGQTVAEYLRLFPECRIYSFEPYPESFEILSRECRGKANVTAFRLAASDQSGTARMHTFASAAANSMFAPAGDVSRHVKDALMEPQGEVLVSTTTLDEFCRERGIAEITILKMDIQGAEGLALHGASGLFARHAVQLVFTEVLFGNLYEKQTRFCDICAFLASHGYILFGLYNMNYGYSGILAWGDAIFISSALAARLSGA